MDDELGPLRCAIVGAGTLGQLLGVALRGGGMEIVAASTADAHQRSLAAQMLDVPIFGDPALAAADADLVVIAVPRGSIPGTIEALVPVAQRNKGLRVIATCGSSPLSDYAALLDLGARVAIVHPLRAVTDRSRAADLRGTPAAITAPDDATLILAQAFVHTTGLVGFELEDDRRALYDAAAALTVNGTVVLQAAALELARLAGIPDPVARNAFANLSRCAVDEVEAHGPASMLGPPVADADGELIEQHLAAIDVHGPQLTGLYARITEAAVRAGVEGHRIDVATAGQLDGILVDARATDERS